MHSRNVRMNLHVRRVRVREHARMRPHRAMVKLASSAQRSHIHMHTRARAHTHTHRERERWRAVAMMMHVSYMFIVSLSFYLIVTLIGLPGLLSCFVFVCVIFVAIKID